MLHISGPEHIDLIFEYSGWVLQSHPEDGLKIFIGDKSSGGEVEQLPRPRVLSFLKKTEKSLIVPYLVCDSKCILVIPTYTNLALWHAYRSFYDAVNLCKVIMIPFFSCL